MLLETKYKHSVAVRNKQSAYIKIDSREISFNSFLFLSYSRVNWTKCWYVELEEHDEAAGSKWEVRKYNAAWLQANLK